MVPNTSMCLTASVLVNILTYMVNMVKGTFYRGD
jgi:hypothetical protein